MNFRILETVLCQITRNLKNLGKSLIICSHRGLLAQALRDFGMPEKEVIKDLFIEKDIVIRMGIPPVRIEVITGASGVNFNECYLRREVIDIDGILVNFIIPTGS